MAVAASRHGDESYRQPEPRLVRAIAPDTLSELEADLQLIENFQPDEMVRTDADHVCPELSTLTSRWYPRCPPGSRVRSVDTAACAQASPRPPAAAGARAARSRRYT